MFKLSKLLTVHEANAVTTTEAKKGTVDSASGIKR